MKILRPFQRHEQKVLRGCLSDLYLDKTPVILSIAVWWIFPMVLIDILTALSPSLFVRALMIVVIVWLILGTINCLRFMDLTKGVFFPNTIEFYDFERTQMLERLSALDEVFRRK